MDWVRLGISLFWGLDGSVFLWFAFTARQVWDLLPGDWYRRAGGRAAAAVAGVSAWAQGMLAVGVTPPTFWSEIGVAVVGLLAAGVVGYSIRLQRRRS